MERLNNDDDLIISENSTLLTNEDGNADEKYHDDDKTTPIDNTTTTISSTASNPGYNVRTILPSAFALFLIGALILFARGLVRKSTQVHSFPEDFIWGAATSAYQIEGGVNEGGRGVSIWDTFCKINGTIVDGSSGAVACDHYHKMEEDVKLMKALGLKAYRFSIAWPRIYPNGTGTINDAGINFYSDLINLLLKHDIEPWVTLYHWDLPQALEDRYGGWMDPTIVDDFGVYARSCFQAFGNRVKHWITINEPWAVAVLGYGDGTKAPGKKNNTTKDVYRVAHHCVLAHARAASIYKKEFATIQRGKIGIANYGDYRYPKTKSPTDIDAAERSMIFEYAWLSDPLIFGDYPREMRKILDDRLPMFTKQQQLELVGNTDFLGLNHYSTLYASEPQEKPIHGSYWADMNVEFSSDPSWRKNYMGLSSNPHGCRELLVWITQRYGGVSIVITENGTTEYEPDLASALRDDARREYFEGYLRACAEAIKVGVPLIGYFAWSLMDNFEWEYGYTMRFGICYVDFDTLERTPKSSAIWYSEAIKSNGRNIPAEW